MAKRNLFILRIVISILLLGSCSYSIAQPQFKVFNRQSGLSDENVTSVVQDQSGFLWVGTVNGLNRFDGSSFKIFKYNVRDTNSLSGNYITCLAIDKLNRIWIGHAFGLTRYDPAANSFSRYKIDSIAASVNFLSVDAYNQIWAGVEGHGLVVVNPETGHIEKRIDLNPFINKNYNQRDIHNFNMVRAMLEDSLERVWLATNDGLYLFDRKLDTVKPMRLVTDGPGKHRDDYFTGILDDKNGGFWLSSFLGGISHYSPEKKLFDIYKYDQTRNDANIVYDLKWKNEKEIWISTWDKRLGILNSQTKSFSFFKMADIFGKEFSKQQLSLGKLFVDRNGMGWVASSMGLVMIDPRNTWKFNLLFKGDSLMDVRAIVEDTVFKKRFLATAYGPGLIVSNLKEDKWRAFTGRRNPHYENTDIIQNLLNTRGDSLWVLSRDNVRLFDKVRERWIDHPELQKMETHMGPISPSFHKMIRSTSGDYWITTFRNGAYFLKGSDLSYKDFKADPKVANSISSNFLVGLLEDKFGRIWFATGDVGISIFDPTTNTFKRLSNEKKGSSFLPTNQIRDMALDREGNVWIGSLQVGVFKINLVTKDSIKLEPFNDDLLTAAVEELKIDALGRIWLRGQNGVNVLNPKTMHVQSFDKQSGLFDQSYYLLESNGRILVNGSIGYGTIDETYLVPDTTTIPLVISSLSVSGKEVVPGGKYKDHLELPYDQNSITIDFAAIDFVHSSSIKYSYKLAGVDRDWSFPSTNKSVTFANLKGGDYVFMLKATNHNGVWRKNPVKLLIHIETPFWESYWFFSLMILGFALFTFGLGYIRINAIKKREQYNTLMNKKIAEMELSALRAQINPHFLFNSLTSINRFIVRAEPVKASEYLINFSRLIRLILEASREQYISLSKELVLIDIYLELESYRSSKPFTYKIHVDDDVDKISTCLPSMVIQPYIENAIWHGLQLKETPGNIDITVSRDEKYLKFVIEDNGIGRNNDISGGKIWKQKSYGIKITMERLNTLNSLMNQSSYVNIVDLKDDQGKPSGTRVVLMLEFTSYKAD